ncbi:hypothetical protein [Leifsonia virtsii]|uniref:Uncharacterized protein n=1 Tax=Leifsonia virtsii TaxID=3035915 RepID=A0ABT8IYZ5_9MICO|nr:hypothetical protein [Leifsonia virtsii]MDN4598041.1 hypothetical protein [Leifsonia virtsii]
MDDLELVTELAYAFDIDPEAVIAAAWEREVPLRDVAAAYVRTLRYLRLHGLEETANAPVTELDSRPPGTFDPRVVTMQDEWWIDTFRRPHRIAEMSPDYVVNVIAHLQIRVLDIVEATGMDSGRDVNEWLEATPLVRALRSRLTDLGDRL